MKTVLVDTNVIIESYIVGCWGALAGGFVLETVEQCVVETQTGHQRRRPEHRIDEQELRKSLSAVHEVTDAERAEVLVRGGYALDDGEKDLWAHALTREDAWILCGPDRTSMRFGFQNDARDKLVSLEELLKQINFRTNLRPHFQASWLSDVKTKLLLDIL